MNLRDQRKTRLSKLVEVFSTNANKDMSVKELSELLGEDLPYVYGILRSIERGAERYDCLPFSIKKATDDRGSILIRSVMKEGKVMTESKSISESTSGILISLAKQILEIKNTLERIEKKLDSQPSMKGELLKLEIIQEKILEKVM